MKDWNIALTELEGEPSVSDRGERYLTLEEAFAEHHQLVYRYACALTRDGSLAEDAAQEVFLRLHGQRIAAEILRHAARVAAGSARLGGNRFSTFQVMTRSRMRRFPFPRGLRRRAVHPGVWPRAGDRLRRCGVLG